jgi:hypothetical protein
LSQRGSFGKNPGIMQGLKTNLDSYIWKTFWLKGRCGKEKPLIIKKMELSFSWNGLMIRYITKMEMLKV